jgi:hypothetical protein
MGVRVAVLKRVANAWIVAARSVLNVGMAVLSSIFGMRRSGSIAFLRMGPYTTNGKANEKREATKRTPKMAKTFEFTPRHSFLPDAATIQLKNTG